MSVIKDSILWIYWNPFKRIVQKIPPHALYPLGRMISLVRYPLQRGRRSALRRELGLIFGSTPPDAAWDEVVKKALRNDVHKELEVLSFPILNEHNIHVFTECRGLEHLDAALSAGRGAMLLFAHFGANQMIMPGIGYRGYTMCQLSAPATVWKTIMPGKKLSPMEERSLEVRTDHELSLPVRHINIFKSIREAFLCLKRNEVLGVAIDGGGGRERIAVDLVGRKALLSPGPSEIARRTGCAVLPTFVVREKSCRNIIAIEPPLDHPRTTDREKMTARITQAFASRLGEYILQHPDHYIGFMALRTSMSRFGDVPLFPPDDHPNHPPP